MTLGNLESNISPGSIYEIPQKVLPDRDICSLLSVFLVYMKIYVAL